MSTWRTCSEARRAGTRLYYLTIHVEQDGRRRFVVRFEVCAEPRRERSVNTADGPRPAYGCGLPVGNQGFAWVEWARSLVGGSDQDPPLPVYVQGHALDRLYRHPERGRLRVIQDGDWIVHRNMALSLREPEVVPMPGHPGKYLAAFRLGDHKVGYLVVRPVDGVALVETFLFLTMNGTPEGDALWRQLRLARPDKEFLELDRFQTFLQTDVRFDPDLVRILGECGCGHLFQVFGELPRECCASGYADEMRKYLGLEVQPIRLEGASEAGLRSAAGSKRTGARLATATAARSSYGRRAKVGRSRAGGFGGRHRR